MLAFLFPRSHDSQPVAMLPSCQTIQVAAFTRIDIYQLIYPPPTGKFPCNSS
uniref:Uncharacterized protein n=1 Tax=Arundo donax TaxID=35708 RepID=A0A0A9BDV5_ARUDO